MITVTIDPGENVIEDTILLLRAFKPNGKRLTRVRLSVIHACHLMRYRPRDFNTEKQREMMLTELGSTQAFPKNLTLQTGIAYRPSEFFYEFD